MALDVEVVPHLHASAHPSVSCHGQSCMLNCFRIVLIVALNMNLIVEIPRDVATGCARVLEAAAYLHGGKFASKWR